MHLISDGGVCCNTLDTIESVMLTKNKKIFDGIKLDIRKSKDDIFVISQDEKLDKYTYAKGNISDYKYCYLRKVKFHSHIFKYYIPTLDEILKHYNKDKIIVLELYSADDLDKLFIILVKYYYQYYFFSKNEDILKKLKELDFDKLGKIINEDDIIKNNKKGIYSNTFLIKT